MLPHGETMCLLDQVKAWDQQHIVCLSRSHLAADHPLRNTQGLPMTALLEYGAQAMAIHGCLLARSSGVRMQEGYLAALRDVKLADGWLSDIDDTLNIEAEQVFQDGGNMIYKLSIRAADLLLVSARVTVIGKMIQDSQT